LIMVGSIMQAQVGIGTTTPAPGSMLDIVSPTGADTKGFVLPRGKIEDVANPVQGMIIWDTTSKALKHYTGVAGSDGKWDLVAAPNPEFIGLNPNYIKGSLGANNLGGTTAPSCTLKPKNGKIKYNGAEIDVAEARFVTLDKDIATVDATGEVKLLPTAREGDVATIGVSYNGVSNVVSFPVYNRVITYAKTNIDNDPTFKAQPVGNKLLLDLNNNRNGVDGFVFEMYGAGGSGSKTFTSPRGGGRGGYLKDYIKDIRSYPSTNLSLIVNPGNGGGPQGSSGSNGNAGQNTTLTLSQKVGTIDSNLFVANAYGGLGGYNTSNSTNSSYTFLSASAPDLTALSPDVSVSNTNTSTFREGTNASPSTGFKSGNGGNDGTNPTNGTTCAGERRAQDGFQYGAGGGGFTNDAAGFCQSTGWDSGAGASGAIRIIFDCATL
jgi:hypothetical protein